MIAKRILAVAAAVLFLAVVGTADAQNARKTGTTIGTITASAPSPNGKNTIIDVKAPGDEAARKFRVQYDPTIKAPLAEVLKSVRAAKVGDQCKFDWVDTGEGLAIVKFEVVKKADEKKEK